jgi:hypothetical protein
MTGSVQRPGKSAHGAKKARWSISVHSLGAADGKRLSGIVELRTRCTESYGRETASTDVSAQEPCASTCRIERASSGLRHRGAAAAEVAGKRATLRPLSVCLSPPRLGFRLGQLS